MVDVETAQRRQFPRMLQLSGIQIPTLCLAFELDVSAPPEFVAEIATVIPELIFRLFRARLTCSSSNSQGSRRLNPGLPRKHLTRRGQLALDRNKNTAGFDLHDPVDIKGRFENHPIHVNA